jgi:hypothetical protein
VCPCVPPDCELGAYAAATCTSITLCSRVVRSSRCLRNEKVRGFESPSSTAEVCRRAYFETPASHQILGGTPPSVTTRVSKVPFDTRFKETRCAERPV